MVVTKTHVLHEFMGLKYLLFEHVEMYKLSDPEQIIIAYY